MNYLWDGKSSRVPQGHSMGDASGMLDVVWLMLVAMRAACRKRGELVTENLLLWHQRAVLTHRAAVVDQLYAAGGSDVILPNRT